MTSPERYAYSMPQICFARLWSVWLLGYLRRANGKLELKRPLVSIHSS
uniref:Uncharacterized protein n=1 Tax=Rhizophora mucronata TaxID=61149 RepID=A0A2P2JA95_RHIMU